MPPCVGGSRERLPGHGCSFMSRLHPQGDARSMQQWYLSEEGYGAEGRSSREADLPCMYFFSI